MLVAMAYNKDTSEITKPSELLSRTRAYMSVLQTIENYVEIGMSHGLWDQKFFFHVLLIEFI